MKLISFSFGGTKKKSAKKKNVKNVWRNVKRFMLPWIPYILKTIVEVLINYLF